MPDNESSAAQVTSEMEAGGTQAGESRSSSETPAPAKKNAKNAPARESGKQDARQTDASRDRSSETETLVPPADIFENNNEVLLVLDMPGADPQSLDVTLDKRVLSVSARSTPWMPEGYTLISAEYSEGNYQRSFILPEQADSDNIKASFKDGVLRLNVRKAAPPPAKKIAVTAN